jgi:hypothetical protein
MKRLTGESRLTSSDFQLKQGQWRSDPGGVFLVVVLCRQLGLFARADGSRRTRQFTKSWIDDFGATDFPPDEFIACGHDVLIPPVGRLQGLRLPRQYRRSTWNHGSSTGRRCAGKVVVLVTGAA